MDVSSRLRVLPEDEKAKPEKVNGEESGMVGNIEDLHVLMQAHYSKNRFN